MPAIVEHQHLHVVPHKLFNLQVAQGRAWAASLPGFLAPHLTSPCISAFNAC